MCPNPVKSSCGELPDLAGHGIENRRFPASCDDETFTVVKHAKMRSPSIMASVRRQQASTHQRLARLQRSKEQCATMTRRHTTPRQHLS